MKVITIHNYQEATKQEIFDFVANHLLTQNEKCTTIFGHCKYRVEKDNKVLKCAAGCLIPDEDYNVNFEGANWEKYPSHISNLPFVKDSENDKLIRTLQIIHDSYGVFQWEDSLIELARKENLQVNF